MELAVSSKASNKAVFPTVFLGILSDYCVMLKWGQGERDRRNVMLKFSLHFSPILLSIPLWSGVSTANPTAKQHCLMKEWKLVKEDNIVGAAVLRMDRS